MEKNKVFSGSRREDFHFRFKTTTQAILLHLQVIPRLKIHPKALGQPKVPRQAESGIRCDAPLAQHDLIDPPHRDADILGQSVLADLKGLEEFFMQNFPRMDRRK
jgi:hypothetical protein